MKKYSLILAIFLGSVLPWLIFSGKEMALISEETTVPAVTTVCVEESETLLVAFEGNAVQEMDLESYILGVLIGEMPSDFEIEALKAQAVVARTFCLKNKINGGKHDNADVCVNSNCCQNYYDPEQYLADGGDLTKFESAISETEGQILLYEGTLIEATYFSCSGGRTEDAQAVWGSDVPYLQSVDSPGEENATHYMDTVKFSADEFQKLLGVTLSGMPGTWIKNVTYTDGGGVASIEIGDMTYSGTQLRQKLGLYSTAFVISAVGDHITVTTKGFGHRVGMSQYGADAMAVQGKSYEEILVYYYQGTTLDSVGNV